MEKEEACLQAASDLHRIMRFSKQKEMENQHEAAGMKSDDGASHSLKNWRVTFSWFIAYFFVVTAVWDSFSFFFYVTDNPVS